MARVVVSHLTNISDEALKRAERVVKEVAQKLGVVILRETHYPLGETDIGKAKMCGLEIWDGSDWKELLVWAEGEGWSYNYIGRGFMEKLALTGIWSYKEEWEDGSKEVRIRLFENGEMFYGYTHDEEGTDFYDFRSEKEITQEEFKSKFYEFLKQAGFPLS